VADVPKLVEAGANIIGGCCGTNPEYIRRAAAVLRAGKS
jgi:5-methyltetrahydrofolate--homocysteine methyltransferase